MYKVQFKTFLVSIFAILSVFVVGIVLIFNISFNKENTEKIVDFKFKTIACEFIKSAKDVDKINVATIDTLSTFMKNKSMSYILKNKKQILDTYVGFLNDYHNLSSLFIVNDKQQSFMIQKINKHNFIPNVAYLLIISDNNETTSTYFDEKLKELSFKKDKKIIDCTNKLWYKSAINSYGITIRTNIYFPDLYNKRGITYTNNFKKGYVLGVNLEIEALKEVLKKKNSDNNIKNAFFFGNKLFFAQDEKDKDIIYKIFSYHEENPDKNIVFINTILYKFQLKTIAGEHFMSYVNLNMLMKPYITELLNVMALTATCLFALFLFVLYFASKIILPIEILCEDSRRIAKRDFSNIKLIKTYIKEFHELSMAIVRMSKSVKQYQKRLETINTTDTLTQIFNRNKLDSSLIENLISFERYNHSFGVMMIDIDHFKYVNDNFGHQVGDEVLKEFASLLKQNIRSIDIVGRWGGEEFLIICKEIYIDNLVNLAEKIRQNIQQYEFKTIGHKTASFGVTICQKNDTAERIIQRADEALYRAKNLGRNKVCKA